jgi:hypothetical protein
LIPALLLYASRSARNQALRRARDPRYLIGVVVVALYFYFVLSRTRGVPAAPVGKDSIYFAVLLLLLVLGSLGNWLLETRNHPLRLTQGERQLLIPAPLSSRELMAFKMVAVQPQLLWNAIILSVVIRSGFSSHFGVRLGAAYLVLLAIYVQRVGVALARAPSAGSLPASRNTVVALVRAWLVASLIVALMQVAALAAKSGIFDLDKSGIPFSAAGRLPWSAVPWPFQALILPAFAESGVAILSSFSGALLVLAVEIALLFRATPDWESVGTARTTEERRAGRRADKQLRATSGSLWQRTLSSTLTTPAAAIAWKNLFSVMRTQPLSPQIAMVCGIPVLLAATLLPPLHRLTSFASGMASAWGAMLLFAGPHFIRNDLRLDLPKLRLLRTYPVTSREICIAEVGASVLVLTLLQFVLLLFSTLALLVNPVVPGHAGQKIALAIALACLLPGMNAINVSAQNIFALMFPRWVSLGMIRPSRTASPGQYYISLLISAGLFLLSMILPAIAALVVAYQLWPLGNAIAVVMAAMVAGAAALGEAALALGWMATLLDNVDPARLSRA